MIPFALKVVTTGQLRRSASARDPVHVEAGPVANDDHRPLRALEKSRGLFQGVRGRRNGPSGQPPRGPSRLAPLGGRHHLHLVGEDEVGHAPVQDRALARQVDQLGVLAGVQNRLAPLGDLAEGGLKVHLLEGPGPEHLGVDLPGQREDGGPVHVGVPEAGQEIRRPGPRNGQTGRRPPGELAVRGRGEGRSALVTDPHEGHLSRFFPPSDGVGEPEVGVPHHPPHPADPPVDQGFRHQVGHRLHMQLILGQPDIDAILPHLHLVDLDPVVVPAGGLSGERMEVPAVPGAAQPAVLDGALAERPALVRALVVQRGIDALVARHAHGLAAAADGLHAALGQLVGSEDPEPADPVGVGVVGRIGHGSGSPWVRGGGSTIRYPNAPGQVRDH